MLPWSPPLPLVSAVLAASGFSMPAATLNSAQCAGPVAGTIFVVKGGRNAVGTSGTGSTTRPRESGSSIFCHA
jgi:hypothetical protein